MRRTVDDLERAKDYLRKKVEGNGGEVEDARAIHMGRRSILVNLKLSGEDHERQGIVTLDHLDREITAR